MGYEGEDVADPAQQLEADDWSAQNQTLMISSLENLDDRSRTIIQRRWLDEDKATLHELADEYGVSAERIRQIEAKALRKLRHPTRSRHLRDYLGN